MGRKKIEEAMYRDRGGVEQDGVEYRGQDGLNNRLCVFEKRLRLRFEQKPESDGIGLITSLFSSVCLK